MSHRTLNPLNFFRKVSPAVLGLLAEAGGYTFKRDGLKAHSTESYAAYKGWSEEERERFNREARIINDLCTPTARPYLDMLSIALAKTPGCENLFQESRDYSVYDLAVREYVANRLLFLECHREYATDSIANFEEFAGKRDIQIRLSPEMKAAFVERLLPIIRRSAGGLHIKVEDYETADKVVVIVYCEGPVQTGEKFDEQGTLVTTTQRRVVRFAAIFSRADSTLFVKAGSKAERAQICDAFAEIVMGDRRYFHDPGILARYDFDFLRDPSRDLAPDESLGILSVSVVRLIVLSTKPFLNEQILKFKPRVDLIDVHVTAEDSGVDLTTDTILGVTLRFEFAGSGKSRFRTVSFTNPSTTNLTDTLRDRNIRALVAQLGINRKLKLARAKEVSGDFALAAIG